MSQCPCNANKRFSQCCWPFISGKIKPETAEQLMRSRYSAYTRANIAYIQATQMGPAAQNFDAAEAKQWAMSVKWLGLNVIRTENGKAEDDTGTVEFLARFQLNKQIHELHEVSEFSIINDQWFYCRAALHQKPEP